MPMKSDYLDMLLAVGFGTGIGNKYERSVQCSSQNASQCRKILLKN